MSVYSPHTADDLREMLSVMGKSDIKELFKDIPDSILDNSGINLPRGLSEYEALSRMEKWAAGNRVDGVSFLGCGVYDHIIPAAVPALTSRGEFLTAYTPYQAEISQGVLQVIYEFQSMVSELTGLDVSNASLYDGHTAAAEAGVIALNHSKNRDTLLYSKTLHPHTIQVMHTVFADLPVRLTPIPEGGGKTDTAALDRLIDERTAGVMLQSPNIYGIVEDYSGLAEKLKARGCLFIMLANPMTLGQLKTPGEWGADLAAGDMQPFGLDQGFGGPTAGYLTARKDFLRKMPGRISGQSEDSQGRRAFVLTLQAREQHIKRQRADSNICSNQALSAAAAAIYMALVGKEGLRRVSGLCAAGAHYLQDRLKNEAGLDLAYNEPFFHEFTLKLPGKAEPIIQKMRENFNIGCGIALDSIKPGCGENLLTVAVTEKRSSEEMDQYVKAIKSSLGGG